MATRSRIRAKSTPNGRSSREGFPFSSVGVRNRTRMWSADSVGETRSISTTERRRAASVPPPRGRVRGRSVPDPRTLSRTSRSIPCADRTHEHRVRTIRPARNVCHRDATRAARKDAAGPPNRWAEFSCPARTASDPHRELRPTRLAAHCPLCPAENTRFPAARNSKR